MSRRLIIGLCPLFLETVILFVCIEKPKTQVVVGLMAVSRVKVGRGTDEQLLFVLLLFIYNTYADDERIGDCVCVFGLCMHAVAVHVIMDIFIPTLCSTAADIARDVAGLRCTVERAAADSHTHTHTYESAYQDIDGEDGRRSRMEEKRTKLNIVLFFFFHFVLLFILLLRAHCTHRYSYFIIHDDVYNNNTHNNIITASAISPSHSGAHGHVDGLRTPTHTRTDTRTHGHTTHDVIHIIIIIAYVCGVREYLEFTRIGPREKDPERKRVIVREEGRSSVGLRCRIVSISRRVYGKGQDPATARHRREMD